MIRHVDFLARLFLIWSGFNAVIGLALTAFAVGAATLVVSAGAERPGTEVAAGVTAATLAVMALAALVWAAAHAICRRGLLTRRARSRNVALVLSVFDLLLLPLGTALGLYAIWVMLNDEVRRQFEG